MTDEHPIDIGPGPLGDGTTTEHHAPVRVGTATNWRSVVAGGSHTAAIRTDGTLWAWADHTNRLVPTHVGTATGWTSVTAGDNHTIALRTRS